MALSRFCSSRVLLAGMSPSTTANPHLSLKVENATAAEAAARLGEAGRVKVEIFVPPAPSEEKPVAVELQRLREELLAISRRRFQRG
jgi:hypothetical protein